MHTIVFLLLHLHMFNRFQSVIKLQQSKLHTVKEQVNKELFKAKCEFDNWVWEVLKWLTNGAFSVEHGLHYMWTHESSHTWTVWQAGPKQSEQPLNPFSPLKS